jgi:flagellar biosynthetic protein FliQ
MDIGQKALMLTLSLCGPLICIGLVIGVAVSIFQAATQIHETTLTFLPKIVALVVVLITFGPWMLSQVVSFTSNLLQQIPTLVK